MMTFALMALISALGIIILLYKLGMRRMLRLDPLLDVVVTLAIAIAFAGTFTGMIVAMLTGLFVSIYLLIAKRFYPVEKKEKSVSDFFSSVKSRVFATT